MSCSTPPSSTLTVPSSDFFNFLKLVTDSDIGDPDNDNDGSIDCEDDDCNGQISIDMFGNLGFCEFNTEFGCDDGFDNDGDGNADCDDPDCSNDPSCSGAGETDCDDAIDNDGDGFSDLAGIQVETSWSEPGDLTIYLRVIGVDGRPATKFHEISVVDISPPQAKIEGSQNITRAFGESISLRGTYSDNWNVVSVKWYLGESLVLTDPSPQKESESLFDLEILIDQVQAGSHTIRMEVTDASGMTSNSTSNLTVYDATPPSVNNAIVEITRFTDETITLEALAVDLESESLGYSWDVDVNIDSDGDGITNNDMDRSGQTLTVTYEKAGIYSLICTVTNDNGLETNIEYIIAIESAQTTLSLIDQIMPYLPIIGATGGINRSSSGEQELVILVTPHLVQTIM